MRCSWDVIWSKPALEFLTVLAYRKDKDEEAKRAIEQWRRRN